VAARDWCQSILSPQYLAEWQFVLDLTALRKLSAKLGRNLDLVQAGGGNTSLKDNGTLWVKASGKWLVQALREDMFLPVRQADILRCMDQDLEYVVEYTTPAGESLRPSVETSMHAVLPHRAVVHVHSVRAIAWAIRTDMPARLSDLLAGLRWEWIPYIHPGLVLGKEIRQRLVSKPDVLILGNHGLVVGADDCDSAEDLLEDVERRLESAVRTTQPADLDALARMAPEGFRIAPDEEVHALALDSFSVRIAVLGTFYPDQCVYVGPALAILDGNTAITRFVDQFGVLPKALLAPGKGVLVSNDLNRAGREVLISLKRVIERLAPETAVRPLDAAEVSRLMNWDAEKYRIALAGRYETERQ
jgi:rhamnose utilization protein RhaD (predicted bifunctional aldolase and dehydrogenase)